MQWLLLPAPPPVLEPVWAELKKDFRQALAILASVEKDWEEYSVRVSAHSRLAFGCKSAEQTQLRRITHAVELEHKRVLPLAIDYGELSATTPLHCIWLSRQSGGDVLATRQIGLNPVTFLGVSGKPGPVTETFQRFLILSGLAWKHLVRHHLQFVIREKNVEVYFDSDQQPDSKQSRKATELLAQVQEDLRREEQLREQSQALYACLLADRFFSRLVQLPTRAEPGLACAVIPAGRLLVAGRIDWAEAESMTRTFQQRWENSWDTLGNVFISISEKGTDVIAEYPAAKALGEIRTMVAGMLKVVVFSDTHLSDKGLLDNFGSRKEQELIRILDQAVQCGALIVIDGDFLELWKTKYGPIRRSYAQLFATLKAARRVVYIAGNHDEAVLDAVNRKHRQQIIQRAKAGVLPMDAHEQGEFSGLLAACRFLQGEKVLLSSGFPEAGLARNGVWYVDESILVIVRERGLAVAVARLKKLKEDWEQHLDEMVADDLGAEVVQYYLNGPAGFYFEHGHISDPYNYQSHAGRLMAGLVGSLERLGWGTAERDLTRFGNLLSRWLPISGLKETALILQRVLAVAGELRKTQGQRDLTIVCGHTHKLVRPGSRGISTFTRELFQTSYVNIGTWSSGGERAYAVPRSIKRDWQAQAGFAPGRGHSRPEPAAGDFRYWGVMEAGGRFQIHNGMAAL